MTPMERYLEGFAAEDKPLGPNEYRCAICDEVHEKAITDAEAAEQLKTEFPGHALEECDIVCDDCYQAHFGAAASAPSGE